MINSLINLPSQQNIGKTERIISGLAGALLMIHGLRSGKKISEIPLGSYLLFRGATGYCPIRKSISQAMNGHHLNGAASATPQTTKIDTRVIIDKPKEEVYAFWRKLENLPLFMKHLESVTEQDNKHSLWSAKIPGGFGTLDWESEIVSEEANDHIEWRSLPDSEIKNSGYVEFNDADMGKTEVHAVISYEAPGGIIGEKVGKLLNPIFESLVRSDIRNFKKYLETN